MAVVAFRRSYVIGSIVCACVLAVTIDFWRVRCSTSLVFLPPQQRQQQQQQQYVERRHVYCVRWIQQNTDEWWSHNPQWTLGKQNHTHTCYRRVPNANESRVYQQLYDIQWKRDDCSRVVTKSQWSSGWAADTANIVDGLRYAFLHKRPFAVKAADGVRGWHYAVMRDGSNAACGQQDMSCYFLPLGYCPPKPKNTFGDAPFLTSSHIHASEFYFWAVRQRQWIRHRVQNFITGPSVHTVRTPCTVMHVRRADVVLHSNYSRRYHEIREYFAGARRKCVKIHRNVLLLTDDANAIVEAQQQFPSINWMYIRRPRFNGTEGGWENQIPSRRPVYDVTVLLSIFRLVRKCDSLIHSQGGFSDILNLEMTKYDRVISRVNIDDGVTDALSGKNSKTDKEFYVRVRATTATAISAQPSLSSVYGGGGGGGGGDGEGNCAPYKGLVVSNILGPVENNLFEIGVANHLARRLCWQIVYRPFWTTDTSFITPRTSECFPYALIPNNTRMPTAEIANAAHIDAAVWRDLSFRNDTGGVIDHEANERLTKKWLPHLEKNGLAWQCVHNKCDFSRKRLDDVVDGIVAGRTHHRVLSLSAFFFHYDWMESIVPQLRRWFRMDELCCVSRPSTHAASTVMIHIAPAGIEFSNAVYLSILRRYNLTNHNVWIVHEPQRKLHAVAAAKLARELKNAASLVERKVVVRAGIDAYDTFCMLTKASVMVLAMQSAFSQMAAVLNAATDIHYPTNTLNRPHLTLKVPRWKYHLVDAVSMDRIVEYDVAHERIEAEAA